MSKRNTVAALAFRSLQRSGPPPVWLLLRMRTRWLRGVIAASLLVGSGAEVYPLDITGYSAAVNDRFGSGFPTAPIANTAASFIGLPYDWSGVGWSTTTAASSSYKGFGFLSPQHYLVAAHYGGSATIRLALSNGSVVEGSQQSVANLGYGPKVNGTTPDLSLGTLTEPRWLRVTRDGQPECNLARGGWWTDCRQPRSELKLVGRECAN